MENKSRVVLITGGATGIGAATALELLKHGHLVAVTYHSRKADNSLTDFGNQFHQIHCELTDPTSIATAVSSVESVFGSVEILIINAGTTDDALLLRMSEDAWSKTLDTNLTGSFRLTKRVLPQMVRNRWGRIIFVSSVIAGMGAPGQANYAASKAGLIGFARSLAREVSSRNITVNVVAPGAVETALTSKVSEKRMAEMLSGIPMGRIARPDDISGPIAFLASEEARYITGTVLPIDGGLSMGF